MIFLKIHTDYSLKSITYKVALMITLETKPTFFFFKPTFLLHFSVTSDSE